MVCFGGVRGRRWWIESRGRNTIQPCDLENCLLSVYLNTSPLIKLQLSCTFSVRPTQTRACTLSGWVFLFFFSIPALPPGPPPLTSSPLYLHLHLYKDVDSIPEFWNDLTEASCFQRELWLSFEVILRLQLAFAGSILCPFELSAFACSFLLAYRFVCILSPPGISGSK